jgi:cytidylate kinase
MNATLKLIERHIAMSDIRNRLEETRPQPGRYVTEDGVAFGPCLLVSRECGSGGGLLAQRAGERLGWNVFDSKIVDEIAQSAHVHQRLVQSVDEHVHSHWERTWREFLLDDLADEKYLHHLKQVVMALGHHGNVVVVGRGAQYFLPSQCALRVRLVAPLETRAERIAELGKLPLEQARSKASQIDSERGAFIWKTFRKDVGSPLNHDLIINTGEISIESATKLVLAVIEEKLGVCLKEQPVFIKTPSKSGEHCNCPP